MTEHAVDNALDRIVADLSAELKRTPTAPELSARLLLVFSMGIGALAAETPDPDALIQHMIAMAKSSCERVVAEIKKQPAQ